MGSYTLQVLPRHTKDLLPRIQKSGILKGFYLAGGTGLALQVGHRISGDLDFFSKKEFSEILLVKKIRAVGDFELQKKSEQTITGILNGTKVSFFHYPYPLLRPARKIAGMAVAHILDIACMKMDAVSSRGTKRDFVDIYFVARNFFTLRTLFRYFKIKYSSVRYNLMHVKKSLVYFKEAENEPMPKMLKGADWREIKAFFRKKAAHH